MRFDHSASLDAFLLLVLIPVSVAAPAKQLYRWVDESGQVYYSDQVPPDQSQQPRAMLNEKGLTIKKFEGAKTPEEIERDRRLKNLRAEKQRLLAEQLNHDRVLLGTYRNEEELALALRGKLHTLDVLIKLANDSNERSKLKLDASHRRAAQFERDGRKVPPKLLGEVEGIRSQIAAVQKTIGGYEEEKERLKIRFEKDIARFLTIQTQRRVQSSKSSDKDILTADSGISVAICSGETSCDRAWALARAYLSAHATTQLQIETEKILYAQPPRHDNDISLSVSKIEGETDETRLFLDVQCKQSSIGKELCAGEQVRGILAGFRPFIDSGLEGTAPP